MNRSARWLLFALLNVVVAVAAGCSGSGPASGAGAAPAAAKFVTGVAATGAPIVKGMVFLKDSSDTPIERMQSTVSDGSFTFDASDLKPPFFLKVASNNQNLYSIATDFGMTNITPLTTIVVAHAAKRDDLDTLYTAYKQADFNAIAQKMSDADRDIQSLFAPLMKTFDCKGSLCNGPFSANHTGMDALMDAISVSVSSGSITIRQKSNNALLLSVTANGLGGAVIATNAAAPITPPAPTSGSALYTSKCAGCHGDSASSNLIGRITVASAQNAIASNRGGMGVLNGLSDADIQAVADYLATIAPANPAPDPTTTTTPSPISSPVLSVDGAALYETNCAECHGSLASSSKIGITVVRLQNAIGGNIGGMGSMSSLSTADMQALVTALNPATPPASTPAQPPATTPSPATPADGVALYATKCAGCHGSLASSSKIGVTVVRLQNAIGANTGGMGFLSTVSSADMQAIVTALNPATPPTSTPAQPPAPAPTPAPTLDGATLYSTNCAACHGPLATSRKIGITLARLQSAIASNTGGMGFLNILTGGQQQALVGVLTPAATTPAPTPAPAPTPTVPPLSDGVALYSANCAGCHGSLASSSKKGITIARLQAAIASNTGGMGFLSTLSVSDVQALVTVLTPATPTPTPTPVVDGATLYASNCASCHGALASSRKAGATASRIQTAINSNTGSMGSLSSLSPAQIAAIETALATVAPSPTPMPPPTPTPVVDGAALYGSNCASCHGALASSSKAGATASRIQTAISNNTGSMGSLSSLSAAQIAAIETALAAASPSPVPAPVCGSCHAIPPVTGHHSKHKSKGVGCATCHGPGYSSTSFAAATHNNGVKNVAANTGWNASKRTCSNSCHGSKSW